MKPRENPFSTERVIQLRYRLNGTYADLVGRLHELGARASIVGMHGNGKTTLLDGLEDHLKEGGFEVVRIQVNQASPNMPHCFWSQDVRGRYVLLDGADKLSALAWLRFQLRCRSAAAVVIVEHEVGGWPVLHECTTSLALFEELVDELIFKTLRTDLNSIIADGHDLTHNLFTRHGGNVRDCLRDLYDHFSELDEVSPVQRRSSGGVASC